MAAILSADKIDSDNGVIHDVRVMTEGEAKGHDQIIDKTTLSQVLTCASEYKNGVKVKLDHDSGIEAVVGFLTNFHLSSNEGKGVVLADLHLLSSHPNRSQVLELAKSIPETFGLSLSFGNQPEMADGKMAARCHEIYSCDLVTEPAANPSLFSTGPIMRSAVDKKEEGMTPEELSKAMAEHMKPMHEALSKMTEQLCKMGEPKPAEGSDEVVPHTIEKKETKPDGSTKHTVETKAPQETESPEQMEARIRKEVMADLNAKGIKFQNPNIKAVSGFTTDGPKSEDDLSKMTFENVCYHLRVNGLGNRKFTAQEAIKFAIGKYPDAHRVYLEKSQSDALTMQGYVEQAKKGRVSNFESKAEHWKVQGFDYKPELTQI